jgi:glycosyltransferase involved in cell wall biosynthesis
VLRQTFQDFEIIVVDNHSTDDSAAVVDRFGDPRILFSRIQNAGIVAKSRNHGVARASGEYVAFLDSDDWWMPSKLSLSVAALDRGADLVYHHLYLVTRANQRIHARRVRAYDLDSPVYRAILHNGASIPQSSVVVRRTTLLDVGGIPEDEMLVGAEDYVTWVNVAKATNRFVRLSGTHGYYWGGGGNLTNDTRTIEMIDRLESRYAAEFAADGRMPAWTSYARGVALYRTGARRQAAAHLSQVRGDGVSRQMRLKSLAIQMMVRLGTLGSDG